ncbi:uncharacterized protein C8A04DRAFT_14604 [Dichotomopilus funicola]|uniref:NACHT-NTPase and P-loop NTPases N-terminal domain-containing protein n=1 Tax=Dichotomopilus funicola TaxID=1934379 RepID=A0AAN6UX97_9PEZI|nr:hypothetical protein C8A04DRAFT_14604 [Dichotomopilus funicola]
MDLGTVMTVVDLVQKAIEIYQKIESLPVQLERLGRRMEAINMVLVRLQNFLQQADQNNRKTGQGGGHGKLLPGQLSDLHKLLQGIQTNAAAVYDVFDRYNKGILSRSKDLTFRASWMAQVWFSLVDNSADKVEDLMKDIDHQRSVLNDYLVFVLVEKAYEPSTPRLGRPPERKLLMPPPTNNNSNHSNGGLNHGTSSVRQRPVLPSPSPSPPRKDYRILFVDPYNEGRSVIAEALLKMIGQLTLQQATKDKDKDTNNWRIAQISSAGFFIKRRHGATDAVDTLDYSEKSFQLPWRPGGEPPNAAAMAAVFDNKWADYPFKREVQTATLGRKSTGLPKDVFSTFDFVVVFTMREHDNMVKLKQALSTKKGATAIPCGKGRVLQLGAYLGQKKGQVREILHTLEEKNGRKNREVWNRQVSDIRTALKGFLRQEMKWTAPVGDEKEKEKEKEREKDKAKRASMEKAKGLLGLSTGKLAPGKPVPTEKPKPAPEKGKPKVEKKK